MTISINRPKSRNQTPLPIFYRLPIFRAREISHTHRILIFTIFEFLFSIWSDLADGWMGHVGVRARWRVGTHFRGCYIQRPRLAWGGAGFFRWRFWMGLVVWAGD